MTGPSEKVAVWVVEFIWGIWRWERYEEEWVIV